MLVVRMDGCPTSLVTVIVMTEGLYVVSEETSTGAELETGLTIVELAGTKVLDVDV